MEIRELRIGNFVYDEYCGAVYIEEIRRDGVIATNAKRGKISGFFSINLISPLALTEEILLKAGFYMDINSFQHLKINPTELRWSDAQSGFYVNCHKYGLTFIKFVHQLQNLYFAITGEELKISL